MASARSLLTEDHFLCSICLQVFSDPVAIPCGHNFCLNCITKYWKTNDVCRCPLCAEMFLKMPMLRVNTFIASMAAHFKEPQPEISGKVLCDLCAGANLATLALKSCLVCLTSYCQTHLIPHQSRSALKRHKLIHPVENLESRICKKHDRPLEFLCKEDDMFLCEACLEQDHKTHKRVPVEEEFQIKKVQLEVSQTEIRKVIQERQQTILKIQCSVETSKSKAESAISVSREMMIALVQYIQRSHAALAEVLDEKQRAMVAQAEDLVKEHEKEIVQLMQRDGELQCLLADEDCFQFLQSLRSITIAPPAQTKSCEAVSVDCGHGQIEEAVTQLQKVVISEVRRLCDPELKEMQRHAVEVTLDPDTAHPLLSLSEDGKQVRYQLVKRLVYHNKPERFDHVVNVLAKQGFDSNKFYFEVLVKGKTEWDLGVAYGSINRKGDIRLSPKSGYWTIWLRKGSDYTANAGPATVLHLRRNPQKIGVFADYEEGQVSFYDVEERAHIYSFTGNTFTERLFPFFSPCANDDGNNSSPLIITPVVVHPAATISA